MRQDAELKRIQDAAKKEADSILEKIRKAIETKNSKSAFELSEKLKAYCDSKSKRILPERHYYLRQLYDLVCEAHFILKRLNENQYMWDQEKRIYAMLGMPPSREPSTDSVINQFKDVFVDHK